MSDRKIQPNVENKSFLLPSYQHYKPEAFNNIIFIVILSIQICSVGTLRVADFRQGRLQ